MTDQRFRPHYRLRLEADFQRVYKRKRSVSNGRISVYACENGLAFSRLGLSVSRRVGPAVVRNRWKRLLREAFRLRREELPTGVDLVVVPRGSTEPELSWIGPSLVRLAAQAAQRLAKDRP